MGNVTAVGIQIGLAIGTIYTFVTGWSGFLIGRTLGRRTAHAAHQLHYASTKLAAAEYIRDQYVATATVVDNSEYPTQVLPAPRPFTVGLYEGRRRPWAKIPRKKHSAG